MNVNAIVTAARASRNWTPIVELVPYACFLGVRLDIKGDQFTACMPFDPKFIGNPALPALHGGATGGFRRFLIDGSPDERLGRFGRLPRRRSDVSEHHA